jgi:shikimate dehydrogenase
MLLGAGGAARAVLYALIEQRAKRIYLVNRTAHKAQELAALWRGSPDAPTPTAMGFSDPLFSERLQECDLLVNSTSVGLSSQDPPLFDYQLLPATIRVCDLIYEPRLTPLLKAAEERGCLTINGLGMLIHQGALSFEIWTGRKPPVNEMKRALAGR